jgi:hypothetical protein
VPYCAVLLPSYLMTRVAATLHSTPLTLSLAALPVSAVLQAGAYTRSR